VSWTLEPVQGGTRLRLEHAGFEGLKGLALSWLHQATWARRLRVGLKEAVERAGGP
jgi:hypothetical protein